MPAAQPSAADETSAPHAHPMAAAMDAAFLAVALLVVLLTTELLARSGAFWRDEVSTILLARAPSWRAMLGSLASDSFPALYASLLRLWIASGLGAGDAAVRLFGAIVALAAIPVLWVAARLVGMRPPIVALALVACNPTYLYWGTSVRAYALAAVLAVVLFAGVFVVTERPTRAHVAAAAATAIAAAQANYQSTYLIFAVCVAGVVVCATRAAWWRAFLCLVIGALAALSLAPYLPVMHAVTAWNVIVQEPVTVGSIAARVAEAVDAAGATVGAVWRVLIAAAVVAPVARLARRGWPVSDDERLRLYGALVIVLGVPAMFAVVKGAGYGTQAWYYLPAMALAAIAAEAAVWGRDGSPRSMAARLALAVVIVALSVVPLRRETHVRRTNMDLVAERVGAEASEQDLVVVNPFWCGVSFSYYYRGRAPWLALPEVAPAQAANPYPVIRDAMTRADPIEPALARLRATLERGGRVWFVGGYLVPRGPALRLAPAPDARYGWSNGAYADAWSLQAGEFVRTHALRANRIPIPAPRAVSSFENLSLVTVDGWRP